MNKQKTDVLIQALPYIQKFKGQVIVIKLGGSIVDSLAARKNVLNNIIFLKSIGMYPVIVHGGGTIISDYLKKMGYPYEFVDGIRVTSQEVMDVTQMVLGGLINKNIVSELEAYGQKSIGLSGKDNRLITAEKITNAKVDYGLVGKIKAINPAILQLILKEGFIPVIAPFGVNEQTGETLNINADNSTIEIAISLKASKLILLTETNGVLKDARDNSSVISTIKTSDIPLLMQKKIISAGMIPKILSCRKSLDRGIKHIHIISGKVENSLLIELFTDDGIGTIMVSE